MPDILTFKPIITLKKRSSRDNFAAKLARDEHFFKRQMPKSNIDFAGTGIYDRVIRADSIENKISA